MSERRIPNKKDYPLWRLIKRWWIEFTCTHWNSQMEWSDSEGWNIKVCNTCHRVIIYTDNQKPKDIE
jgi:hypothetical protein